MSSIIENKERIANFTSSEIYKLIPKGSVKMTPEELKNHKIINPKSRKTTKEFGFDTKGMTYIDEKRIELKMGRSIRVDSYSKSMAWGNFMEQYVFSLIGFEYLITSNDTDMHPTIKGWSGSKDLIVNGVKISDIKCYEPKNFAKYTDVILQKDVELLKSEFPKEYWQLVSNAIINQVPKAEVITFMPYKSELDNVREMAENYDGPDQWKYRFISESDDSSLPYLPDNGHYSNLNTFEFEVPKEDIELLTNRVKLAIIELHKDQPKSAKKISTDENKLVILTDELKALTLKYRFDEKENSRKMKVVNKRLLKIVEYINSN